MSLSYPRSICIFVSFGLAICCPPYLHPQASSPPRSEHADSAAVESQSIPTDSIVIPGPLRSFLRMAGISQEVPPEDVLPMLARNVVLYGFDSGREKEFLILVDRYVHQAREIERLSAADGKIHVNGCSSANDLLGVLGYKFQRPCGHKNTALMTANAERAFLTIDSGFPLTALEQALQKDEPFSYSFPATRVPIIFTENEWLSASVSKRKTDTTLLDLLLHDPAVDRLYAAMAKYDQETRRSLQQSPGIRTLMTVAAVADLYGSQVRIKSGRVIVPGDNDKAWEDLLGESPQSPGQFVTKLLTRDRGWLEAYFDVENKKKETKK